MLIALITLTALDTNRTLISLEKIQAALDGDSADLGISPEFRQVRAQFDVHVFDQLPSTSTKLWEMLAAGAGAGTVAIAHHQSSGRGQRGRVWCSEPGGLYLSLALEPDWPVTHSAQLTCLSAWGIATAFRNLGLPVQIKWPNDLFFEGKKIGGILTETKLAQSASVSSAAPESSQPLACIKQAIIGVGINWHNLVPETGITLAEVLEALPESAAKNKINCLEVLAALVLKGIIQGYLFQQQVGSQVFMKAYSNLLIQVGKVVSLESNLSNLDTLILNADLSAASLNKCLSKSPLRNCSGEVVGVSEEGYLQVVLLHPDSELTQSGHKKNCIEDILLFKPSEIHIS